ncbi:Thymidylate kinase [Halomicrobium sp. LC1Hm]|nr:Thymidylate kinase [Halomicrobium sp. LC1Hm]
MELPGLRPVGAFTYGRGDGSGMLLTLEGLDGSGKTTAWETLQRHAAVPDDAVFTREPTESWYGEAVQRSIDDDEADSLAELFLYTADHADHLANTVEPALDAGRLVVSDRYSDSRYAYQGATLSDRLDDALGYVRDVHAPWTRPPDATIYLDVDAETAAERSGATNKFETADYLADVRENYERLIAAEPDRFVRIDATQPERAVRAAIEAAVDELLSRD